MHVLKIYLSILGLLFLVSCKAGKVSESPSTYHLQLSLASQTASSSIFEEYQAYGLAKLRPTSRSKPQFITKLTCSSKELQELIELLEKDKRVLTVKKIEKPAAKKSQSTNGSFGKSRPKN